MRLQGRKPSHTQMMFDESDNRIVYYGTNFLYRTTRTGRRISSPARVSPIDFTNGPYPGSFADSYGTISSIHVPESGNGEVIYLGTDDGNVWVSRNKGKDWTQIDETLPERWVTRVTADPNNPAIVYVTFSGYSSGDLSASIYRSDDYGTSWKNISGNLPNAPLVDILIDPDYPATLYTSSDFGVYVSYDTGTNWQPLGTGLPKVIATDLKIIKENDNIVLYAGTYGRSIYSVRLTRGQRGENPFFTH